MFLWQEVGYLPNGRYLECLVGGMIIRPSNGGFQLATYWLSVMSSLIKLGQSSASIVACCPWWRKHDQHPRVLE